VTDFSNTVYVLVMGLEPGSRLNVVRMGPRVELRVELSVMFATSEKVDFPAGDIVRNADSSI
jgi:hypothetical protein